MLGFMNVAELSRYSMKNPKPGKRIQSDRIGLKALVLDQVILPKLLRITYVLVSLPCSFPV